MVEYWRELTGECAEREQYSEQDDALFMPITDTDEIRCTARH